MQGQLPVFKAKIPDRFDYEHDGKNSSGHNFELPVRIGYWDEKLALREEKISLINKKRGRMETLTFKKNQMFENLCYPLTLAEPNAYIHYGDPVQISTDILQTTMLGVTSAVLSTIITEKDIDISVNLCHGCPIVASQLKNPCRKNVFTIVDPKHGRSKERICYGDDIYICIFNSGTDRTLYIQAAVPTYDDFGGASEHYALKLSEYPDRYCKFKIIHHTPELRDVHVGDNVPSNTRICIAHTVSNRFLVTENSLIPSLFGAEMAVSCFRYKVNNKESAVNYWEISIKKQKNINISRNN